MILPQHLAAGSKRTLLTQVRSFLLVFVHYMFLERPLVGSFIITICAWESVTCAVPSCGHGGLQVQLICNHINCMSSFFLYCGQISDV